MCCIFWQYLSTCAAGEESEEPGAPARFQLVGTVEEKDKKRKSFALEEYWVSSHTAQKMWDRCQKQLCAKHLGAPGLIAQ